MTIRVPQRSPRLDTNLRIAGALVALLLAACGSGFRDAAIARATVALSCPTTELQAVDVGGGGVQVTGCGQTQSYTCMRARGQTICSPDGSPSGTHVAPSATASSEDQRAVQELGSCGLRAGTTIEFYVGVDGDVLNLDVPDDPPGARECAADALARVGFARRGDADRHRLQIADPLPDSVVVASPVPPDSETAARAAADGLRDAILLCTGGAGVAVIVDWTADGALTVHLPDPRAGSPEDGCIRATATRMTIPAPGAPGSLLHAVH